VDENIIRQIINSVRPADQDYVVEIGPGRGALTSSLLQLAGHLEVIEIDRDLISQLKIQFGEGLTIHSADVLKIDFNNLYTGTPFRVVGNLPYNISTPLIFKLIAETRLIKDMHFMLQKEVVDRLASSPSTAAYGRLGIMVQYHCRVEKCFDVPPGAFRPAPKVNSAVVRLIPHDELPYLAKSEAALQNLVTTAFTQRRKTLRNALKSLISASDIEAIGLDPSLRPENISVQDYVQLANAFSTKIESSI
jgi:16S rRNA (adenine1518-N6/adenine1519-N6)-dimethyltransferase